MVQVFFFPAVQTVTPDGDLVGTPARDNHVKYLSPRKAQREGHMADVISDALYNVFVPQVVILHGVGTIRS